MSTLKQSFCVKSGYLHLRVRILSYMKKQNALGTSRLGACIPFGLLVVGLLLFWGVMSSFLPFCFIFSNFIWLRTSSGSKVVTIKHFKFITTYCMGLVPLLTFFRLFRLFCLHSLPSLLSLFHNKLVYPLQIACSIFLKVSIYIYIYIYIIP